MNRPEIVFTPAKRDALRGAYEAARAAGHDRFTFEGAELLVSYTKYLLEYLDAQWPPSPLQMKAHLENHGSIWLLRPLDSMAREWLEKHTNEEAQWFGGALIIEPRYVQDITDGFVNDGGEVS